MRRLTALAFLVGMAAIVPSQAVAAPFGTIKGTLFDETTQTPLARAQVTLMSARADGSGKIVERATTDADGRYEFERLPAGDDRFYALETRHDGGLFAGPPIRVPSGTDRPPVIETTLRVWDTTTDPSAILIRRNDLFVVAGKDGASVIESIAVVNQSPLAYIGRASQTDDPRGPPSSRAETLGIALPRSVDRESIHVLESDIARIAPSSFGLAATVAIPPRRESRITFSYRVGASTGSFDLSRVALYPIADMTVYAAPPLTVESNRLPVRGAETIGRRYETYSTDEAIDAGDAVQIGATPRARFNPGLVAGIVAAVVTVMGAIGFFIGRRRGAPRASQPADRAAPADDTSLEAGAADVADGFVEQLATLDLRYRAGEIDRSEWAARRAQLRAEATGTRLGERTP